MKTKYDAETTPIETEYLARCGHSDKEIFKSLKISCDTFYKWIKKYTEFAEALKRGRKFNLVTIRVENALLKLTEGYNWTEEKEEITGEAATNADGTIMKDENGRTILKRQVVKKSKTIKHVAPNVTAQIYFLNNRQPDRWSNKEYNRNIDGSVEIDLSISK